jgi:subtilisin family serine protease
LSRSADLAFKGHAWVLELDAGADLDGAALRLQQDPQVLYAGPNHLLPVTEITPNDSLFSQQYALASARVPEAWETTDGAGILIAIIDTGVELDHPDLQNQIAVNAAEANGLPGVDDDGNGFVDDVRGFDFTDVPGYPGDGDYLVRDPDPSDDVGHGTEVAGVAAAERNNARGIAGVAPDARILPVRAGFHTTLPFVAALLQEDDAAAAILYAADRGAKVLNLSFGDVIDAPLIRHAVRYARERGALVVASSGNTGADHPFFPASYPGVLVPGASTRNETRADFSTYGQDLDLLAPGVGIYTTDLGGTYRTSTGTSFSAPMTSGVAALVWSAHPDWNADEVAWAIRLGARRDEPGWQPGSGWGLLDAAAAVQTQARPPVIQIESHPPDGLEPGIRGTLAAPDLLNWNLSVLPESSAVTGFGEGERALVTGSTRQVLNDSLAGFTPPSGEEGFWVFRLVAHTRERGVIEERSRAFLPAPEARADSIVVEAQADSAGWSLAAWWSSPERQQGALRLFGADIVDRFAIEPALGRHHGVRLDAPLPAGTLDILARSGETQPFTLLSELPVTPPRVVKDWAAARNANFPSGTPMATVLDRDENGFPEVFVETPPSGNLYGFVKEYEVTEPGVVTERGASDLLFRGIPVDAADSDHDANLELVVFRLDAWDIWESSTPSGFPDHLLHQEIGTRPVRFIDAGLLVVTGGSLRLVNKDGSVLSEASSGGPDLEADAAIGDFDGDAREEIAIPNQDGSIAIFELSGTDLQFETLLHGPVRFEPVLVALANGLRTDLVTVERDPPFPNQEGDLDRAATRLRLWDWDGAGFRTTSTLAFAGMISPGHIELFAKNYQLWLRRDRWFDAVALEDSLVWRGRVFASKLPRVDGFTLAPVSGMDLIWIGTSAGSPSEDVIFARDFAYVVAGPLEVRQAAAGTQGLDVVLGWEENCGGTLARSGDVRGTYPLTIVNRSARDTVAIGESVRYTFSGGGCGPRDVFGRPIESLQPRWEKSEIALDFATPLRRGPLPEVLLRIGNRLEPPRAVHLYKDGKQLLVVPGKDAPDSIIVIGAWQVDGLPLGGSVRSAAQVPPYPGEMSPAVLADVRYDPALHVLHVTLGGDSLACDPTFVLQPENRSFPETVHSGSFDLALGGSLASGVHTLEAHGSCIAEQGSSRTFRVGRAMYPNPVGPGQDVVVEGIEPGDRIALYDLNGQERLSWRATGNTETRSLDVLAPGLYLVRFEGTDGKTLGIEKLAIIR